MLEKIGHRVLIAENGQIALEILKQQPVDLVLMDMQMPLMGGLEATHLIRENEKSLGLPRIPIIALTANALERDREACLAVGMDYFLTKPLQLDVLSSVLHEFY